MHDSLPFRAGLPETEHDSGYDIGAQISFTIDVTERISKVFPKLEDGTYQPEEVALLVIAPEDTEE